jgi:neutral ceramidase
MHPIPALLIKAIIRFIKYLEKFRASISSNEHYKKVIERKYRVHGVKDIMIESNTRRIVGTKHIDRLFVPAWADPAIATFKYFHKKVGHINKPWTPKVLPIQLFIIGDIALAGFPFEITTIAGKRLQKSLEETLSHRGVKRVILCPYANGYSGYITTNEEYQAQIYEGGHTVFGEWSLAALQTKFEVLAQELLKTKEERRFAHDAIPPDFTEEELNHFPFYKRAWYIRQELIRARKMERKGAVHEF